MSVKARFVKCLLCVILYLVVYFFLLKAKEVSYLTRHQFPLFVEKCNQTRQCPTVSRVTTKSVDLEIKILERDEMKGEAIDLQQSAMILRQLTNICAKYNLTTPLIKRHFLHNSRHKSLYCWIRKVASTSFAKLFADMKIRSTRTNYREIDTLTPRSLNELQLASQDAQVFKLLVVRHPFQRLVSSYRDRIEDNSKYTAQAWIYVEKIFRLTRPKLFHSNTKIGNFRHKVFTPDKRLKIVPTFKEFVEWLVQSSDEDDVHWAPYYKHCALCNVRYNYVLKLDDYTYGQINYIFSKFGLDKTKVYFPKLKETRGGQTNFDITCKYLKNLTEDVIFKLYEKYKIDFQMYNYNVNRYMNCAMKKFGKP